YPRHGHALLPRRVRGPPLGHLPALPPRRCQPHLPRLQRHRHAPSPGLATTHPPTPHPPPLTPRRPPCTRVSPPSRRPGWPPRPRPVTRPHCPPDPGRQAPRPTEVIHAQLRPVSGSPGRYRPAALLYFAAVQQQSRGASADWWWCREQTSPRTCRAVLGGGVMVGPIRP